MRRKSKELLNKKKLDGFVSFHSGGDHISKSFKPKRESVDRFILNLQYETSHYCREKSSKKYLPSDFSARNLYRCYSNEVRIKGEDLGSKWFWTSACRNAEIHVFSVHLTHLTFYLLKFLIVFWNTIVQATRYIVPNRSKFFLKMLKIILILKLSFSHS